MIVLCLFATNSIFFPVVLFGAVIVQLIVVLVVISLLVVEQCPISLRMQAVLASTGLHSGQELSILILL